ncbi:zinc-dependent alcohol dehydrogenase family protein [Leuconostoc mesenteroides]|nr:zinc-dependent alcohol dehydrogenase family protein [Leuconostoc mesenteroides]
MKQYFSLKYEQFGSPLQKVSIVKTQASVLSENQLLVQMTIVPINPSDLIPITGAYQHRTRLPSFIGYEGVGIVKAVGHEQNSSFLGKRILLVGFEGTWQEFVVVKRDNIIIIPEFISDITAAQSYINPMTAWIICQYVLDVTSSDFIAINASGSNLGKALIQICRLLGIKVIAIVRNSRNSILLQELGAQYVINTSKQNIYTEIMKITNSKGVNFAIDSIGGSDGMQLAKSTKLNGTFIAVGLLSKEQVDWSYINQELSLKGIVFHLRHWVNTTSINKKTQEFAKLFSLIENSQLKIGISSKVYPMNRFNFAIKDALDENVKEKVFLRMVTAKDQLGSVNDF